MKPIVALLISLIAFPFPLRAQEIVGPDIWHTFAAKLETGKALKVRLKNGQRFKATLLDVSDTAMTLQPKTRAAVPPQRVAFDEIETLEVDRGNGGGTIARAVGIGAAVGAGAFLGLMMIAFAALGD
jgi:hypothetical protein